MNNFNKSRGPSRNRKDSRSGGKPRFSGSGRPSFGGGNGTGERRELYPAVCSKCGKQCQVPFRPTGDKPVYCRECFGMGGNTHPTPEKNFRPRERERGTSAPTTLSLTDLKRQLDAINTKVDSILEIISNASIIEEPEQTPEQIDEEEQEEEQEKAPVVAKKKSAKKK